MKKKIIRALSLLGIMASQGTKVGTKVLFNPGYHYSPEISSISTVDYPSVKGYHYSPEISSISTVDYPSVKVPPLPNDYPNDYIVQPPQSLKNSELPSGGGGGEGSPSKRMMPDFPESGSKEANNQQRVNFHQEAENYAKNPDMYFANKKVDFQRRLQLIDADLKAGKNPEASRLIDESIKIYGPEPKLIMRKALVGIREGRLNAQEIAPEGVKNGNQSFHDVINQLIANNRDNFKAIDTGKAIYYIQTSPGLNNLDFKQPIAQTVPFNSGARAYKLESGEISGVNISESGLGDVNASSHTTQLKGENPDNVLKYLFLPIHDESCSENDNEEKESKDKCPDKDGNQNNRYANHLNKPVYMVVMPEK